MADRCGVMALLWPESRQICVNHGLIADSVDQDQTAQNVQSDL